MVILTADIIKECVMDLYPDYSKVVVYGSHFGDKIGYWYSLCDTDVRSSGMVCDYCDYIDISVVIGWIRDRSIDRLLN